MDSLGANLKESVYTTLSAILHLGNVNFENNDLGYAIISPSDSIELAANLLAVDSEKLTTAFLTRKIRLPNGDVTNLYVKIFHCIVKFYHIYTYFVTYLFQFFLDKMINFLQKHREIR